MSIGIREGVAPDGPLAAVRPTLRRTPCWPMVVLLTASIGGLVLAHGIARGWNDPSDDSTRLATAAVAATSLTVLGVAISRIMKLAESRWRQVFRGRRLLACAALLSVVTAALAGSLFVVLDPFHDVAAHGHITATDIADAGWLFAIVICWVGALGALLSAWDAYGEERNWGRSLGIGG